MPITMSDQRKFIKVKCNNQHTGMITCSSDWAAIAGDELNHVVATTEGVQISTGAGKDIVLQTLSCKRPFVRDTPFPLALLAGPFSMPQCFPDIPLLPLLPTLQPMLAVLAGIGAAVAAYVAASSASNVS